MTTPAVVAQATLKSAELSYLLNIFEAGPVIGLNNKRLSGTDGDTGFDLLVSNGWFVKDGAGWNLNDQIALMAAVMAAPEQTLMVTRHLRHDDSERRQVVTYYLAEGVAVEQFQTGQDEFLISQLRDVDEVLHRSAHAAPDSSPPEADTALVDVPTKVFAAAMTSQDAAQRAAMLDESLVAAGATPFEAAAWSEAIVPKHALVVMEAAAFVEQQMVSRQDIYYFGSPAVLVVGSAGTDEPVTIGWATTDVAANRLAAVWQRLSADRQQALAARVES